MSKSRLAIAILSDCINFSRTREHVLSIKKALDPIFERHSFNEINNFKEALGQLEDSETVTYLINLKQFKDEIKELHTSFKNLKEVKLDALKLQELALKVCQSYSDLEDPVLYDLFKSTFEVIGDNFTEEEFASKFKEVIESIIVE